MNLIKLMSYELSLDEEYIEKVAKKSRYYYKHYTIPKKNGGVRNIYHPSPVLKVFQYWLVNNILSKYPISIYSYAYKKGASIKKNAMIHANSSYILHIDIKDFFESITKEHLKKVFEANKSITKELNLDDADFELICNLCFFNERLTIGSVSSPIISNIIMFDIDYLIAKEVNPIVYTRYADDLVFSSSTYIDEKLVSKIEQILRDNGFMLNTKKTHFMSKKQRHIVTGLVVDKGKVTIGLKNKKRIKSMVYKKLKYGEGESDKILGNLFFLKDIEPDYFNKIIIKYSNFGNVLSLLSKKPITNDMKKEVAPSKE